MPAPHRIVAIALLTALGGTCALADIPGLDLGLALDDLATMAELSERGAELDARARGIVSRMEAKVEIAEALVDGRLSLLQAAVRLRLLLDKAGPWLWDTFRVAEAGTDDERLCRHVIGWVRYLGTTRGREAEKAADALEEELTERLESGALVLPPR